jgi:ligand-binding sensor domain-containing protein
VIADGMRGTHGAYPDGRHAVRWAAATALAAACAGCASVPAGASGGSAFGGLGGGPREERVVIRQFDDIGAVAAGRRLVFATSFDGVAVLDRQTTGWLLPFTRADGYPGGNVTAIAADPIEDAVWIALPGALVYIRPLLGTIQTSIVPGPIDQIMFDQRGGGFGAYVRSAGQWLLATRTGDVQQVSARSLPPPGARQVAPTLRDIIRQFPSLQDFATLLTRDEQMQSWPITSGAKPFDVTEVWLGTRGGGLFRVDPEFRTSQHFPFGLMSSGAGALALAADGVWIAGTGASGSRGGLTFATRDLQRWRWVEGSMARQLAGARAYKLGMRESIAWLATDRGLARFDANTGADYVFWNATNGLPADAAYAVAPTVTGAWVGTARGLVFVTDSSRRSASRAAVSRTLADGVRVNALLLTGDTLWIGSDAGLLLTRGAAADSEPVRAAAAATDARFRSAVRGIARADSIVAIVTDQELIEMNLATGQPLPPRTTINVGALRGVTAMTMDAHSIWITGLGGLMVLNRDNGVVRMLASGTDLPGDAYDVAIDPEAAWVATRDGLVRLKRSSDGTLP